MTPSSRGVASPPAHPSLPEGFRIAIDPRIRIWADGSVLIGGAPWRVSRIRPPVQALVQLLATAGPEGHELRQPIELAAGRALLDRGFAIPVRPVRAGMAPTIDVVVPAMDHADNLDRVLTSLGGRSVVVVDDGSHDPEPVAATVAGHGARLVTHPDNQGPAAARNTGLAATTSSLVGFVDSDCVARPDWPIALAHHFDDPLIAAVAPRIAPTRDHDSVLERYEATRSSLDMGRQPELVRPGARLGFVPTASLVVRRSALGSTPFDERLRLGEDVDLIWRLAEAGWIVRYDPSVTVGHRTRSSWGPWLIRRYEYGTSAPDLEDRHPGRLTPARVSAWNLATLGLTATGHPVLGAGVTVGATAMLWRELRTMPRSPLLAARTVGQGLIADAAAVGHLLRREWWPIGAAALALSGRSRLARAAAACMLAPLAYEWATNRPPLDPLRYGALRILDDAAYGSGVIASSIRSGSARPLLPKVRLPRFR